MKTDIGYGDVMKLAALYANETNSYALGTGKPGALAKAHENLQVAVRYLEYMAFKNPPCKICIHDDEPPTSRICCDCVETNQGWSSFVAAK